jgi:hypothetical protein
MPQDKDLSDDELDKLVYGPAGKRATPYPTEQSRDTSAVTQFREGGLQGLLNVPETLGQLAERSVRQFKPDFTMPLHDRAREFRNRVESSPWGIAGEVAGSVFPSFIPGIGQYATAARGVPLATRAGYGFLQGVLSRPSSTNNEYLTQGATGALAGAIGGAPLARAIPPHIGHWLYSAPAHLKHWLGMKLIQAARSAPPGTAATAAGAMTPRDE